MDLSGIIFVVLAIAWAVYLIPKALKHHDEIARTRSIDRFSTAMRVLAHREPVNRRDTRLVVTPARPGNKRVLLPTQSAVAVATAVASAPVVATEVRRPAPRSKADRAAARAAAKRRRHIVIFLLLALAATAGAAGLGYLPWWSLSIPGGLTVTYLFLCNHRGRRAARAERRHAAAEMVAEAAADSAITSRRAVRVEVPHGTAAYCSSQVVLNEQAADEVTADEDTVGLSAAALSAALAAATVEEADSAAAPVVAAPAAGAGSLWDPLPMTLPTYVNKPRAARSVRTIDLSEPNTWSSGRSEADSKLVEDTAAARDEEAKAAKAAEEQRAVGS